MDAGENEHSCTVDEKRLSKWAFEALRFIVTMPGWNILKFDRRELDTSDELMDSSVGITVF